MVDRSRRTAMTRDLLALMKPDAFAGNDGTYRIRSLYFDTPDFMAYHEKLAGVAVRHKLRARVYGDPKQADWVRLEVKSRYIEFIKKIAVDLPRDQYVEVERALRRRVLPPPELLEQTSDAREFFRLQRQYNKEPRIIIEYRRQAFERCEVSRTRINFDDELRATRHLDLLGPLRGALPLLQASHSILEIKVDGVMPYWLHTLIRKYDLQNQAISKFCHGVRSQARLSPTHRADGLDVMAP